MTTGSTRYVDISSLLNDIYEDAVFTLRHQNLLVRTVRVFNDTTGMHVRKNSQYGAANPREVAETEDVSATKFDRTLLSTLTPKIYADQILISDERENSDDHDVDTDAAIELGAAFAEDVDSAIAGDFASLTGGTIGSAGSTILWPQLIRARGLMQGLKIPGPYWCALHPYQWAHLVESALTNNAISNAQQFTDNLIQAYFVSTLLAGVTFVISGNITIDGSGDAIGAMYSASALAYDERTPFALEPQRDASRRSWEINANLRYAHGVWLPNRGIQLVGDASTPS
jgi:hypothetical protein